MEERHSIPAMLTTTDFLSLHPQHQYFQYYSSPTINNTAATGIQMSDIYGGVMSSTYCHQDPRVQGHQHSSSTLDVNADYEVRDDQEDHDCELLTALINNHIENKEEEIVPWQAAADDVSSWEWPRFDGTLESIIDQSSCLVPLTIQHVPNHGVHDHHGNEVEEEEEKGDDQVVLLEDQEYCHREPQVLADQIENTAVQSKHSKCNTEWMTFEEEDEEHDQCYPTSHTSTPLPPPSYHSQREARKITEKRQMRRGKSSAGISSSINKRSKATIQSILHNKSERKRRGKINDRLEILQKLLPNFHKQTDKASMLDQVIEYVKKLQTQNDQLMNMRLGMFDNNNMPVAVHHMMMMMSHYITTMQAMQQQQQQQQANLQQHMSMMMSQMGMGMSTNPADLVMMPTGSNVRASEHETGMSIYAATRPIS